MPPPMKAAPMGPPAADEYAPATCAQILNSLQILVPAPTVNVRKMDWTLEVERLLNVNQWRAKLVAVYNLTAVQAQQFGTRHAACTEAFRRCPFA